MIERVFQGDHPALPGHFPGNPVVPGALLLSETLQAIEAELGRAPGPWRITAAKFLRPARPGERILIRCDRTSRGDIRFSCSVGDTEVLTGQVSCGVPTTAK